MGDLPVSTLVFLLVSAVLLSAFFSGTETALMSVNRYIAKAVQHCMIYSLQHEL